MRVSETLNLNIPDDGLDVDKLERYVAREIRKFGKVLQEIEAKKLEEAKGKVGCREKVPRYPSTRLGLIRFERHKVKYKEKGKFGFFLDDVLGLRPYQSATRWVRQRALQRPLLTRYRVYQRFAEASLQSGLKGLWIAGIQAYWHIDGTQHFSHDLRQQS